MPYTLLLLPCAFGLFEYHPQSIVKLDGFVKNPIIVMPVCVPA
jgi:hypothetical protein